MYENFNTKYKYMHFCLNITETSSCVEHLDFKSNSGKDGVFHMKLTLKCA
jgi:hypothetical protein